MLVAVRRYNNAMHIVRIINGGWVEHDWSRVRVQWLSVLRSYASAPNCHAGRCRHVPLVVDIHVLLVTCC